MRATTAPCGAKTAPGGTIQVAGSREGAWVYTDLGVGSPKWKFRLAWLWIQARLEVNLKYASTDFCAGDFGAAVGPDGQ